jgi:cytochrome b subunit of formate dehydrogenase
MPNDDPLAAGDTPIEPAPRELQPDPELPNIAPSAARPPAGAFSMAVDAVCFLAELGMLVLLAISGWALGNGGLLGICLAVLYPALAILVWAVWLAPRSQDRLDDPARLVVQILLFAATATATAFAGHVVVGIVFGVIAIAAFAETRVLES